MSEAASPFVRAVLFIADLDRSTRFYRALDLTEVVYEGALEPASINALLALPPTTATRCRVLLKPGDFALGSLALVELSNPSPAALDRGDGRVRAGETTLVFYVEARFDEVLERLINAGGRMTTAPMLFDGPFAKRREALLRDPDGVLINVIDAASQPDNARGARTASHGRT